MGPRARSRGRARVPEPPRVGHRDGRSRPCIPGDPVLRGGVPLPVRGAGPGAPRVHGRGVDERRVRRLEGPGPGMGRDVRPDRPAAPALQPPPADPGGGLRGPGEAAGLEGPARRRRRARLAGGALPRGGRRRDDRDHRLRRRRPVQPPAPGRCTRRTGSAIPKVESARRSITALNPDVRVVTLRGDAPRRQRRAGHRGLRRDRGRDRHLRDPVPPQRRRGGRRDPRRACLRVPVRGPAVDLRPVRGSLLPLPVPDAAAARAGAWLPPRPSWRPAAPSSASWAWCPGSWACSRPPRPSRCCSGSARRWPAACSCSMPSRWSSPSCGSAAIPPARSARMRPAPTAGPAPPARRARHATAGVRGS